jgi:hypothetical protein
MFERVTDVDAPGDRNDAAIGNPVNAASHFQVDLRQRSPSAPAESARISLESGVDHIFWAAPCRAKLVYKFCKNLIRKEFGSANGNRTRI